MSTDDPFHPASASVLSLLTSARPLLSSYLRIRSTASTPTSPELLEARRELELHLNDLSSDLHDLVDSVAAVEHDPRRYGLSVAEVQRRRKLVSDVGGEVAAMGEQVRAAQDSNSRPGAAGLPDPTSFEDVEEDAYSEWEQQRQQETMEEQDEALEGVFTTVGNLRAQADDMGRELVEQDEMLKDVDTVADRVGGKLKNGIKRVGWVIKKNEGEIHHFSFLGIGV